MISGHLPPSLVVAKGSAHTHVFILGDDAPQDAILFLELINLLLEVHYFLTELARDG